MTRAAKFSGSGQIFGQNFFALLGRAKPFTLAPELSEGPFVCRLGSDGSCPENL